MDIYDMERVLLNDDVMAFVKDGQLWFHVRDAETYNKVVVGLNIDPTTTFTDVLYSTVCLQDGEYPLYIGHMIWFNNIDAERLDFLENGVNWGKFEHFRETEIFQMVIDYTDLFCTPEIGDFLSNQFASLDWDVKDLYFFVQDVCSMLAAKFDIG